MKTTYYTVNTNTKKTYKIALLADLHSNVPTGLLDTLQQEKPDLIAIPGDLIDGRVKDAPHMLSFLETLTKIAPTFYAGGNHELFHEDDMQKVRETGVTFLQNEATRFEELTIGGIASGFGFSKQGHFKGTPPPDLAFLEQYAALDGYKLLLSHHPEYYKPYLQALKVDLVVSGHAHGGQWRVFGRGIFAPGQGLFPRYTAGFHDNRFVISRGMGDHTRIPRIHNPHELVVITLTGRP